VARVSTSSSMEMRPLTRLVPARKSAGVTDLSPHVGRGEKVCVA
jgi:hypothetical protein